MKFVLYTLRGKAELCEMHVKAITTASVRNDSKSTDRSDICQRGALEMLNFALDITVRLVLLDDVRRFHRFGDEAALQDVLCRQLHLR